MSTLTSYTKPILLAIPSTILKINIPHIFLLYMMEPMYFIFVHEYFFKLVYLYCLIFIIIDFNADIEADSNFIYTKPSTRSITLRCSF